MTTDVRIAIPSLQSRHAMLCRSLSSVEEQVCALGTQVLPAVHIDVAREGAWTARNKAATAALEHDPDWVGFLDDDDVLLPFHVQHLLDCADEHGADIVWGWFDVVGGQDPFPHHRGQQLDVDAPHIVPITYMVRAQVLASAMDEMGGFQHNGDADTQGGWWTQDWPLLRHMLLAGAVPFASDRTTWHWHHHGRNTSGLPNRF